jgi:hypothetical protein
MHTVVFGHNWFVPCREEASFKYFVFVDILIFGAVCVFRRSMATFGETYCLHLQGLSDTLACTYEQGRIKWQAS